jgi:hypothetical protein
VEVATMMHAELLPRATIALPRVVVARGGRWTIVDLRRLYTVERVGARVVSLADIWVAGGLRGDLFALAFDFLDVDGNPASRWDEPRLDAGRFVNGWLDVETREVSWDANDFVPSHWHLRHVATIVAVTPGSVRGRRSDGRRR